MEFALSQDQRMLQDSLRKALAGECTMARIRTAVDGGQPMDADVWRTLCEVGVPALLVPEEHDGLGLTLLDAAIAAEELGRAAAPTPFLGTAVLAPLALTEAGSAAQQAEWLPRLAAGEAIIGVGLTEALSGARDGAGLRFNAGRLSGRADFVLDGLQAQAFIVAVPGGPLVLVDAAAPGIRRRALHAIDGTRPTAEVHFDGVPAEALPDPNAASLARIRDAAWIMMAAVALGAAWTMIDMAVGYSKERRQFGRLIGAFQAVKHACADMLVRIAVARQLVMAAVTEPGPTTTAMAKSYACDTAVDVAGKAMQLHGGIGYTWESGVHVYLKRAALNRSLFGSPADHRARLAGRYQ